MTSPQQGHVTNFYGFFSTPISPTTSNFSMMVDQHALILFSKYDDINANGSRDQSF